MDDVARCAAEQACVRGWVEAIRADDGPTLARLTRSDTSYGIREARAALLPALSGDYEIVFNTANAYTRCYWLTVAQAPICAVRVAYSVRDGAYFIFGFDRLA